MDKLALLMAGLFSSLAGFFGTWLTKKVAFGAAAIATFAVMVTALTVTIATGINLLIGLDALPVGVANGMRLFMPSNLPLIVSTVIAADTAIALYRWNVQNLKLASFIT